MSTAGRRPVMSTAGRRPVMSTAAAILLAVPALAACGHSGSGSSLKAIANSSACQNAAAVLSDGPDPDSDPVGYAEAQVTPLQSVHSSDAAFQQAIDTLDRAYQAVVTTNGSRAATQAESKASDALNHYCPGAAP